MEAVTYIVVGFGVLVIPTLVLLFIIEAALYGWWPILIVAAVVIGCYYVGKLVL